MFTIKISENIQFAVYIKIILLFQLLFFYVWVFYTFSIFSQRTMNFSYSHQNKFSCHESAFHDPHVRNKETSKKKCVRANEEAEQNRTEKITGGRAKVSTVNKYLI